MEFPDGETIAKWKFEFGEIFSLGGYIFRPLKVGEYKSIANHKDWNATEIEDFIVKTTILHPKFEDLESLAGLISSLSEEVMNISCFGEVSFAKKALSKSRENVNQVTNLMKVFILAAMPQYTDEKLDQYTFSELSLKVALAEKILEVKQGGMSLELVDPEEEEQKQKDKVQKELSGKKAGQAISTDPIAQKLRSALG